MRGPINIWRLIVTGATFARTGALGEMLDAMQAPPLMRVTARTVSWTFAWLGKRGDPALPPVTRAITDSGYSPNSGQTALSRSNPISGWDRI